MGSESFDGMPRERRPLSFAAGAVEATTLALAAATAAGLALGTVRGGAALHPHWLGSTGSAPLDATVAGAFAALVLGHRRLAIRAPGIARVAAGVVGSGAALLVAAALTRHLVAIGDGRLRVAGVAPPMTLIALALIVPWTWCAVRGPVRSRPAASPVVHLGTVGAAAVLLGFAQVAAFGATDYRAPADAILVLGAKVQADGRPSGSLLDRTRTACALWREGLAPVLVLSGGRDPAVPASEPEVMRRIAHDEGVPDAALILDEDGVNTAASVRFVAGLARERGWHRVLAVSHGYHLARVRLLADREGLVVRTVPAAETAPWGWKMWAVPREVAAYAAAWVLRGA